MSHPRPSITGMKRYLVTPNIPSKVSRENIGQIVVPRNKSPM